MGGGSSGGTVPHFNQIMLQNLQSMLMANPSYLTGGIPNKLLSQMWMPDLANKTGNNILVKLIKNYIHCIHCSLFLYVR